MLVPTAIQTGAGSSLILTHPLRGYYRRRDGRLGSYAIWHERLNMVRGVPQKVRFSVFEDLGLTTSGTPVHSLLLQQQTEFIIELPPQEVSSARPGEKLPASRPQSTTSRGLG